jgi:hypothetical protein
MGRKKKQPWGITLNCVVLALVATLSILGAIALAFLGTTLTWTIGLIPISGIIAGLAFFLLVFGIIDGVLCYYLWNHDVIAWWIVLIISALGLISAIFTLPFGVVSVLISIALVLGLLHKDTIKAIKPTIGNKIIKYKGWG